MDVTPELVRRVAALARLELTDEEVGALVGQLDRILAHVERIGAIEAEDDPATQAPVGLDALAADEPGPTLDRRQVAGNAPEHDGAFLVVPGVFESED